MRLPNLIYWFATSLLSILLLFGASMHLFNNADVVIAYSELGYPAYLIFPMAIAKILAVVAIVSTKSQFLKNLAYAGVFYNLLLAFISHLAISDGAGFLSFAGLVLLGVSYLFHRIIKPKHKLAFDVG